VTHDELVSLCEEYGYLRAGPNSDLERWLRDALSAGESFKDEGCSNCGSMGDDDDADGVDDHGALTEEKALLEVEIGELKEERERNTKRIKTLEDRERQAIALLRGVASEETKREADAALDRLSRTKRNRPRASD
jgi:hypothetical protein